MAPTVVLVVALDATTPAALATLPDGFVDWNLSWMDEYLRRVKVHVETGRAEQVRPTRP